MKILFSVLSLLIVASAAEARSPIRFESFDMYGERFYKPSGYCDRGTKLKIDYVTRTVSLVDFVKGVCEIFVDPFPRVFTIKTREKDGCGSYVYTAFRRAQGGKPYRLTVSDNRQRTCRDIHSPIEAVVASPEAHDTMYLYSTSL